MDTSKEYIADIGLGINMCLDKRSLKLLKEKHNVRTASDLLMKLRYGYYVLDMDIAEALYG